MCSVRGQGQEADSSAKDILNRLAVLEQRLSASDEALRSSKAELNAALLRIQALEAARAGSAHSDASLAIIANSSTPPPAVEDSVMMPDMHDHTSTEVGKTPRLTIRGFGDLRFGKEEYANSPNSFAMGQLDLYIASRLSERTHVLMETVFEPDKNNVVSVDIERILLQQRFNRYFNLEGGRNHTAIGYYNMAYHHGTWFQTAVGRPFIFAFEDEGGLLPIHSVGIRASGAIPSGSLGLQYSAELGNGRSYEPKQEAVQNRSNLYSGKAFNIAFTSAPEGIPGLQLGTSLFRETLYGISLNPIEQTIVAAHAVYDRGPVEILNEAVWMHHQQGPNATAIFGGYDQVAYHLGHWHPYARFEYLDAAASDPIARLILPTTGSRQQMSSGVRFDFSEFAALKLQIGRLTQTSLPPTYLSSINLAFTF